MNLNLYFHISLWRLKRFYEDLNTTLWNAWGGRVKIKWVLLKRAPSFTQFHPPPPCSTQLSATPSTIFGQKNIARNWTISSNLGWKIKISPFWLKSDTHGIMEVLISNPDLDFWNCNPKIHFWANLGPNIQSSPLCLKIGAHSISRMLNPNPDLDFWNFDPKNPFLGKFGPKNSKLSILSENWYTWYLKDADSYSNISFLNFKS